MDYVIVIYLFIVGLFLGSFLNLVSDRLHLKQGFVFGRSKCDFCDKNLSLKDLIPVVSFILNKARCRSCNNKLSYYYPISEVLSGLMLVLVYSLFVLNNFVFAYFFYYLVMLSILTVIFLSDLKYFEIPFKLVILGSALSILYRVVVFRNLNLENIFWEVLSLILVFIFFASVILLSKGGMGGGDLKLSMMLSLFLGYENILQGLYVGFLMGGLFSIILLIIRKKSLKSKIPLSPFLILGSVFTLFFPNFLQELISGNYLNFVF